MACLQHMATVSPHITVQETKSRSRTAVRVWAAKDAATTELKAPKAKQAQGKSERKSMVMRVDDPLAGRDYRPPQEGDEPDFWEGAQFNLLGFVAQYLWVLGIVLAIVSSGYAVRSYNDGAADFKDTEVYKDAIGVQLLGSSQGDADVDDAPPL